jgi:hypothetical protein
MNESSPNADGRSIRVLFILAVSILALFQAVAQNAVNSPSGASSGVSSDSRTGSAAGTAIGVAAGSSETGLVDGKGIPASFRGITLGMGMERVKQLLQADVSYFSYRGDEDVSLLPSKNQTLIEVAGFSYVKRAYFQFLKDKLYTIILSLNTDKVDYYTMYRQFALKYGEPPTLSPQEMAWSSDTVRLSLERPLSVKYIDLAAFKAVRDAATETLAMEDIGRQDFLNEF